MHGNCTPNTVFLFSKNKEKEREKKKNKNCNHLNGNGKTKNKKEKQIVNSKVKYQPNMLRILLIVNVRASFL